MSDETMTGMLPVQRAIAGANPRGWRDGIVVATEGGTVVIASLDGGLLTVVTAAPVEAGDPVAVHLTAELVAAGSRWYSAR